MPQKKITYRLMSSADDEKEFYAVMGKFFASAKVRRDFHGYPLNNDDARQWIVAFDGENVIGFGSFGVDKNEIGHLYDAWVHPDFRKRGIHTPQGFQPQSYRVLAKIRHGRPLRAVQGRHEQGDVRGRPRQHPHHRAGRHRRRKR